MKYGTRHDVLSFTDDMLFSSDFFFITLIWWHACISATTCQIHVIMLTYQIFMSSCQISISWLVTYSLLKKIILIKCILAQLMPHRLQQNYLISWHHYLTSRHHKSTLSGHYVDLSDISEYMAVRGIDTLNKRSYFSDKWT